MTDSFGRSTRSDCPKGFWCKVQIPGIPEAGIPEVAVCVPEKSTGTLNVTCVILVGSYAVVLTPVN